MLSIVPVTASSKELEQIKALYKRAFPANERDPFASFLTEHTDESDFIAFYDGKIFCGFAYLLTCRDITHILYFAIDDALRGKGYGSQALYAICSMKPYNRIIADVEVEREDAPNEEQREHRIHFYIENGFVEANITYDWQQESYEIMVAHGKLSRKDFDDFWHEAGEDESAIIS